MRKLLLVAIISLLIGIALRSQVSTPAYVLQVQSGTTIANCPVVAGQTQFCFVATGAFWSLNGGPYTPMISVAVPVAAVQTVNGKKPDATGNVALAATTSIQ